MHPVLNEATLSANSGNKGGKSNAFIYLTYDRKYILKTLSYSEVKFLRANQLQFNRHFRRRPDGFSYIAKVLGLYKISDYVRSPLYLVLMENIINPTVVVSVLFDLKGSKRNRSSLEGERIEKSTELSSKKVYKDLDFLQVFEKVELADEVFQDFQYQLMKDVGFLESLKVMDYSLLMAFTESLATAGARELETADGKWRMHVGIIDFLQRFNSRKKLEVQISRIRNPNVDPMDISCVNHHLYADRFLQFIWRIVKPQSQP